MYDFYGNPPTTKEQIREYITTWLTNTNDETVYQIHDESYVNELGFRRAFYIHSVFKNINTDEYKWYVVSGEDVGTFNDFPAKGYPNFESLIDGVVEDYYKQWKLDG